ncbi:hypothetical protein [Paraburkholderia dinghuensis]|uniref:Uncharacterized protein n=1 Tax=Paraburkholderia dinghuensis TaxID=2305225 RepID=A0A3N6PT10_9BURK|nr:hypothetical protein [Paraburkholderia dinghuensis]RQH02736.1 hypothetical protein D1Y85_21625 [Paraburkholderia dinghuensis]
MIGFDDNRAMQEGWSIFDCEGSANGPWQLQRIDEDEKFMSDGAAWEFVVQQAHVGSVYHASVLNCLYDQNRIEFDSIFRWIIR